LCVQCICNDSASGSEYAPAESEDQQESDPEEHDVVNTDSDDLALAKKFKAKSGQARAAGSQTASGRAEGHVEPKTKKVFEIRPHDEHCILSRYMN
jgi:hypothetical protein